MDALAEIDNSIRYYAKLRTTARRLYWASELALVVFSAAIPVVAIVFVGTPLPAALLGGIVVIVGALRGIFHWHDNWTRFSMALVSLTAERRLYVAGVEHYNDASTREARLLERVNSIEKAETGTWMTLEPPREPK